MLKPDYVYITGNDRSAVNSINKKHVRQTLIIDGSNSDRTISLLRKQADNCSVNYHIIKRNISLLVVSN